MPVGSFVAGSIMGQKVAATFIVVYMASAAMLTAMVTTQINPDSTIWSVTELRLVCLCGALGGSVVSLAIPWPNYDIYTKGLTVPWFVWRIVSRLVVSQVSGSMLSPLVMTALFIPKNIDTVLGVSFCVAFVSYASLAIIASNWPTIGPWLASRWFGSSNSNPERKL